MISGLIVKFAAIAFFIWMAGIVVYLAFITLSKSEKSKDRPARRHVLYLGAWTLVWPLLILAIYGITILSLSTAADLG